MNNQSQHKIASEGTTSFGQPILSWEFGKPSKDSKSILVLGCVHGDEVEGFWLVQELIRDLVLSTEKKSMPLSDTHITIIPCYNPDGFLLRQRWNAQNVDLNRNLPTINWKAEASNVRYPPGPKPASELETQAFLKVRQRVKPNIIISVHSHSQSLVLFPQTDSPLQHCVKKYAETLGIPIVGKMDYQIYGSLSSYGREQRIPCITIELLKGKSMAQILEVHTQPFLDLFYSLRLHLR